MKAMDAAGDVTEWTWAREGSFRQYFAPGSAWAPLYVQDPIELWAGVRILEVRMGG